MRPNFQENPEMENQQSHTVGKPLKQRLNSRTTLSTNSLTPDHVHFSWYHHTNICSVLANSWETKKPTANCSEARKQTAISTLVMAEILHLPHTSRWLKKSQNRQGYTDTWNCLIPQLSHLLFSLVRRCCGKAENWYLPGSYRQRGSASLQSFTRSLTV